MLQKEMSLTEHVTSDPIDSRPKVKISMACDNGVSTLENISGQRSGVQSNVFYFRYLISRSSVTVDGKRSRKRRGGHS